MRVRADEVRAGDRITITGTEHEVVNVESQVTNVYVGCRDVGVRLIHGSMWEVVRPVVRHKVPVELTDDHIDLLCTYGSGLPAPLYAFVAAGKAFRAEHPRKDQA